MDSQLVPYWRLTKERIIKFEEMVSDDLRLKVATQRGKRLFDIRVREALPRDLGLEEWKTGKLHKGWNIWFEKELEDRAVALYGVAIISPSPHSSLISVQTGAGACTMGEHNLSILRLPITAAQAARKRQFTGEEARKNDFISEGYFPSYYYFAQSRAIRLALYAQSEGEDEIMPIMYVGEDKVSVIIV